MSTKSQDLEALVAQKYRHGFVTDIESDTVAPGLDEDVITFISRKKREPQFLLDWRLKSYRHWLTMREPHWAHVRYPPIDYRSISYYSAPKVNANAPKSLEEVDPKLLATYDKLGIPLREQAIRIKLTEYQFFATALTLQARSGGGSRLPDGGATARPAPCSPAQAARRAMPLSRSSTGHIA